MTSQVFSKRKLIVEKLANQIRRGEIGPGQRLDGEHRLAEEFDVSRGTIRQALGELQRRRLISIQSGIGSFVTYDGHALDQRLGWAQALAEVGSKVTTRVLSIEPISGSQVPGLPDDVALDEAIAVRRVRTTPGEGGAEVAVSFECASVPAVGSLRDLPIRGLKDDSLWASLREEGLIATNGQQSVDVHQLDEREASILGRPVGSSFLRTVRTSYDSDGQFVEHVLSLLDPSHFTLKLTFGDES
ncbi:GntR family transcriptional regulator [Pseudarthrobacter sp. R1]|uniref:GntR family transcriptional regulator n=1 Tax=Pseudarthrobacter sp. R1 TaxID=2944934 RepID=UPI0021094A1B|nr:GntR family transcriptional regulator [Pseudarthrobacter sp. R1]MCQ6272288.1 GntR family transcriptional regulator [Pseudarthrobacter sp. R1]